ncbi:MAG: primosomal protein N' [Rubrivivax sp.]
MVDLSRVAVAVDAPAHAGLAGTLAYACERPLAPGTLVQVPLGRRTVPGIVWRHRVGDAADLPASQLRSVHAVIDALLPLSHAWMRLVEFAAAYYQRSVGEIALSALPGELRKLGNVQVGKRLLRLQRDLQSPPGASTAVLPEPSEEQTAALAVLSALAPDDATPTLLQGVTGSGKTEVYLRRAASALAAGRQVLVLVPEINLTPQLEARFAERFAGRTLVSLHSALTPAQRLRHWLLAHIAQADLVLGTRLAVFASMPRLGLIVVDEEHDPSFKQHEGARYSARDLAVMRAHIEKVPVLLGSATPSLETWAHAERGRYRRLSLHRRVGDGALPQVRIVDMNTVPKPPDGAPHALAPALQQAIAERIERGEQSLLFLNRRGYAPVLHCAACDWKSACAHCSAWRVFHKADRTLRCHHCGFTERVPRACPECGNQDIAPIGRGTEKLQEQMALALPGARVARIDADSTRLKGALQAQLAAVHNREVDVLVGTQMIAKGHDFRGITLVAAVNPDTALFASDFRAAERLFALLMQAAGRAGRDATQAAQAQMWVQTWHPQHALYAALRAHDFDAFARSQLEERRGAGLPPFTHLALLRAEAKTAEAADAFLQDAAAALRALPQAAQLSVYPAVPTLVSRVADVERMQMLVESASRASLQQALGDWMQALHALRGRHRALLRWAVDVDPLAI